MNVILNFENEPINVDLFDQVVRSVYEGNDSLRNEAQSVLTQFKEHPLSWTQVDSILDRSQYGPTKFFCLQVLDELVNIRWDILPPDQRNGVKNYVVNYIIGLSSSDESLSDNQIILNKFNVTLINIVKKEWPHNWNNFISELVHAAQQSESICQNNLNILTMLSEEVFDFSNGNLTETKINELKTSLENDFSLIFQLCEFILTGSSNTSLINMTLKTLVKYLEWIPPSYVIKTKLAFALIDNFLPVPQLRNKVMQCLTEMAAIDIPDQEVISFFQEFFVKFMNQLVKIIPETTDINYAYTSGQEKDRSFVQNTSLFFDQFLKVHIGILENPQCSEYLYAALNYMLKITTIEDLDIFDITLDFWNNFASELYNDYSGNKGISSGRLNNYVDVVSNLSSIFVSRMAKPEEVIIIENEDGEIIKEIMAQGEVMARYKRMKTVLVYLTNMNQSNMRNIMINVLHSQANNPNWSRKELNCLCWAIGSIENIFPKSDEKSFLIEVLTNLLNMCENVPGTANKAIVASNIMYIVGQYPRFLSDHSRFLLTVILKLFEFMHEPHPGVKDMACETFLKIAKKCKKALVKPSSGAPPIISEILRNLNVSTSDLNYSQLHIFFEAMGYMIGNERDISLQQKYLSSLMLQSNQLWREIMDKARNYPALLQEREATEKISHILKLNSSTCSSAGDVFSYQLQNIYMDLLHVYKYYSEEISTIVAQQGERATNLVIVKNMRAVKRAALGLISSYIGALKDPSSLIDDILPPLLPNVLEDYKNAIPGSRDHEVLALLTKLVTTCKDLIIPQVHQILDSVFECTLGMITANFQDFPEHRVEFFNFMRAVNKHCFVVFKNLSPEIFDVVIHSIIWAMKHEISGISDTGLNTLKELLELVHQDSSEFRNHFYLKYCFTLMEEIFFVLLDSVHKSGFPLQSEILFKLFQTIESGRISQPIYDVSKYNDISNQEFIRVYLMDIFTNAFPNTAQQNIRDFIVGILQCDRLKTFRAFLRDFLIEIKQYSASGDDNSKLYGAEQEEQRQIDMQKEMLVPGMVPAHDPRRDNEEM